MPLGNESYTPFSEIAIALGHTSYSPQWSKTAECDRLINLMYDEALRAPSSSATIIPRAQAITEYAAIKRSMAQTWFPFAEGDLRNQLKDITLNTLLIKYGETQFGRIGRFHRALMAVFNETVEQPTKGGAYQIWLNNIVAQIGFELSIFIPPFVSENTIYRIDNGPAILNTGADIDLVEGQKIDMYTSGINFSSSRWQLDAVDVPGAVTERLTFASLVIADTGAYTNIYTNSVGDTVSDPFNVVVT